MGQLSRRAVLGGGALGALGVLGGTAACGSNQTRVPTARGSRSPRPAHASTLVRDENQAAGTQGWMRTADGTKPNQDALGQVSAFASKSSYTAGERITFYLSTARRQDCTVAVHRLGHYRGAGGRLLTTSPRLAASPQAAPVISDTTGEISCPWDASWSLEVPTTWLSGLYLATVTTADGHRTAVPFAVRDDRPSDFLVVLPFTTYQAYNTYPVDGRTGKSLYYGFVQGDRAAIGTQTSPDGHTYPVSRMPDSPFWWHYPHRARTVSFRRPYSDDGLPKFFELDQAFVFWAESQGLDVSYASSLDLHEGRVDLSRYAGLLFSGHDEYWSQEMRTAAESAVAKGASLAYLGGNSVYWKIRAGVDQAGFSTVTCYKSDPDPADDGTGATRKWRDVAAKHRSAEQVLLGSQYQAVVLKRTPLVVSEAKHWLWTGTGLAEGDRLPDVVAGEADGVTAKMPGPSGTTEHTLLSTSPFPCAEGTLVQNTSLYQARSGAWVFNAGTFGWTPALGWNPTLHSSATPAWTSVTTDPHIQRATRNLLDRLRT